MKLLSGSKIRPLDNQINKQVSLIPKIPFSLQIVGAKGASKSTTILNMLLNKDLLAGKFNSIFWISPTSALDSKLNVLKETKGIISPNTLLLKKLKEKNKHIRICGDKEQSPEYTSCLTDDNFLQDCSTQFLTDLMDEQKHIITSFGKNIADNVLLIYDDCASEQKHFKSQAVQKLIFNSRHVKISIIFSVQNYTSLPKPLRLNNSLVILFDTSNRKELENIYTENCSSLNFKEFYSIFKSITETPFAFLTINYQNPISNRYQANFEKFILLE